MAKGLFEVGTKELTKTMKKLNAVQKAPRKAVQETLRYAEKRAPGWVAAEVAKTYNIKRNELEPGKAYRRLEIVGNKKDSLSLRYSGRRLTPVHFGMKPAAPLSGRYSLKMTVFKGKPKTIGRVKAMTKAQRKKLALNFRRMGKQKSQHSPNMLMSTGAKSVDKVQYIPFSRPRPGRGGKPRLEKFTTTSIKGMVENEEVSARIQEKIADQIPKRLEYYLQKNMPKK